jgi:hypothetical protein
VTLSTGLPISWSQSVHTITKLSPGSLPSGSGGGGTFYEGFLDNKSLSTPRTRLTQGHQVYYNEPEGMEKGLSRGSRENVDMVERTHRGWRGGRGGGVGVGSMMMHRGGTP